MPTTTDNLDKMIDSIFESEQKVIDAFGKAYARLPEQVRTAKLPMADKLIDPVALVNKGYAVAEKVLGDTETGKLITRQKALSVSFAEYFAPHFAA